MMGMKQIKVVVGRPQATDQVERYNRIILDSLTAYSNKLVAINNTIHKDVRKTLSELLMEYKPKIGTDVALIHEVITESSRQQDLSYLIEDAELKSKEKESVPNYDHGLTDLRSSKRFYLTIVPVLHI